MLAGLLPEDELCLLLARGQLPPDVRARALELTAGAIKGEGLLKRSEEHQVLPLIYRSLRAMEFQEVPLEVQAKLEEDFPQNAVRNMLSLAAVLLNAKKESDRTTVDPIVALRYE